MKNKITYHSINWVKKLKYCRRVIINNVAKFRGCAILRTRVIRQRVSLKIIVFRMETQCWSPSEGLQHGGRKPVKTSGVHFGSCTTFLLPVKLENIRIGTSFNILVTQNSKTEANRYFRARNVSPRKMPMSLWRNCVLLSKQSGLPSWGQARRYMFANDSYLMKVKTIFNLVFFWRHVKTKNKQNTSPKSYKIKIKILAN